MLLSRSKKFHYSLLAIAFFSSAFPARPFTLLQTPVVLGRRGNSLSQQSVSYVSESLWKLIWTAEMTMAQADPVMSPSPIGSITYLPSDMNDDEIYLDDHGFQAPAPPSCRVEKIEDYEAGGHHPVHL